MPHTLLSPFVFDCNVCHTRCDGKSKAVYLFENDTAFSEKFEQLIIERINQSELYFAQKSTDPGFPDISVFDKSGNLLNYVEVKVQQRTFMTIQKVLPFSNLMPSETLALNLSDLLRYFRIFEETKFPTSIVWVLLDRLCITSHRPYLFYFQRIHRLKEIYEACGDTRRFRRKSGEGDIVNGEHKGVTVNYHFSLKELIEWKG